MYVYMPICIYNLYATVIFKEKELEKIGGRLGRYMGGSGERREKGEMI